MPHHPRCRSSHVGGTPRFGLPRPAACRPGERPGPDAKAARSESGRGATVVFALTLRISTTAGDRLREDTELVILDQLADVGIEITIDNREGSAVFEKFFPIER